MSESEPVIPVENAVITQIWTNVTMCVGACRAIDCFYHMLSCHCRPIHNKPACDYRTCSLGVILIPTGAASRTIVCKGENVWGCSEYFVDYRIRWQLSPERRWDWEMR